MIKPIDEQHREIVRKFKEEIEVKMREWKNELLRYYYLGEIPDSWRTK